jgi:quercetin dioxygenase-like cupin family protein
MTFLDTNELPVRSPRPGWDGRFFNSENMTFAYYAIDIDSTIHEHSHPNEEIWHVLDGELEVTIAGETRLASAGWVAIVPPDTLHSVRALTNARVIVVDYPLRASVGSVEI